MERLYSKKDLIARYGVCLKTLTTWVTTGRIEHLRVGNKVKFTERQIEKFEKAHTVKATINRR